MRRIVLLSAAVLVVGVCSVSRAEAEPKYISVKKCSMCHRSDAKGNQYKQWLSTKHANAYKSLATQAAAGAAKAAGVSGNPQEAAKCLKCHVTGYGLDGALFESGFSKEDGVQCEAWHGAGSDYKAMGTMKDKEKAIAAGLIIPTQAVCVKCHNADSPSFTGFNFDEYYSKIAHPRP